MTDPRTTQEVFDDHLALAAAGDVETDLERNYDPDVVILWRDGIERGRDAARRLAAVLEEELPQAVFTYTNRLVAGDVAFLEWTAEANASRVRDGADSFVIRGSRIVAQTIHYTVEARR